MSNGEDDGQDIGDLLRRLPKPRYPGELYTATKAEYTTNVKKMKKPGCPLLGGAILGLIVLIIYIIGGLL